MNVRIDKVKEYFREYKFADSVFFYYLIGLILVVAFFSIKVIILIKGLQWIFNFDISIWQAVLSVGLLNIICGSTIFSSKE